MVRRNQLIEGRNLVGAGRLGHWGGPPSLPGMTRATCKGMAIEYESFGEGEPLLLEMGLGGQLVAWPMDWVNLLVEQGFRVIRYDNRDVGLSSKTTGEVPGVGRMAAAFVSRRFAKSPYLISDMADDAAALLDCLGIERAHVVGVSMGGMIAQSLAIQHPDKVSSLTSIMSNTGEPSATGGCSPSCSPRLASCDRGPATTTSTRRC